MKSTSPAEGPSSFPNTHRRQLSTTGTPAAGHRNPHSCTYTHRHIQKKIRDLTNRKNLGTFVTGQLTLKEIVDKIPREEKKDGGQITQST